MQKHHLLITGTGRAGTTFLMQIFSELGMNTGFANSQEGVCSQCNAGMEWETSALFNHQAPYVVKSPALCEHIEKILAAPDIVVDCVIIPVRDLYASAESRRRNARRAGNAKAPGGLWLTKNPRKQEAALAEQFHHLVHVLVAHDVPTVWLSFPRLVEDGDYLWEKLRPALLQLDRDKFQRVFHAVSQPALVHQFKRPEPNPSLLMRLNSWMRG
jgi:hypothetical protein